MNGDARRVGNVPNFDFLGEALEGDRMGDTIYILDVDPAGSHLRSGKIAHSLYLAMRFGVVI